MSERKEIVGICRKVYNKGFTAACDGNISARTDKGTILITRSGLCKGETEESDIIEIDSDGKVLSGSGKISTENKMHLFIYMKRKDINAVLHCHPVYATAFAASGKDMTKIIFPEVMLTLGKIHLCRYATPSTADINASMEPFVADSSALLLENHGAVTMGINLKDAYFKMEKLEHTAKVLLLAQLLGGANEIPEEKVKELIVIAKTTYGINTEKLNIT